MYREALSLADQIHLTRVHCNPEADTFFPDLDEQNWSLVQSQHFEADEQNDHPHTIELWQRKR